MTPKKATATIAATIAVVASVLYVGGINPETDAPEPITVDGQTIEFTWTDDNTDEDLEIWTDKQTYTDGLSHADVYVAVVNKSKKKQDVELLPYFADDKRSVKDISVLKSVTTQSSEKIRNNCREMNQAEVDALQKNEDFDPINYSIIETTVNGPDVASSTKDVRIKPEIVSPKKTFDVCDMLTPDLVTSLVWEPVELKSRSVAEKALEVSNIAKDKYTRKPVSNYEASKKSTGYGIGPDEVVYYKMHIEFPKNDNSNFFIEAIGSEGGYGNLDPWFNASWTYRISVTVDDAQVPSTLSSFPVYVDLADLPASFFTNAKSDGCDIRVVESDETTETAFELVSYDAGGTGELHFMADSLTGSGGGDTVFYIYYGNSGASCYATTDTYGAENVWAAYDYVSHDGGSNDSTANGYTTTDYGGVTSGDSTGQIGDSTAFDGNDYFQVNSALQYDSATAATWQAWVKATDATPAIISTVISTQGGGGQGWATQLRDTGVISTFNYALPSGNDNAEGGGLSDGTWGMLHFAYDNNSYLKNYVNGVNTATDASVGTGINGGIEVHIGARYIPDRYWIGEMDEVRLTSNTLDADWIASEYTNQSDTTTFYTVGSEETGGGGGATRRIILVQ